MFRPCFGNALQKAALSRLFSMRNRDAVVLKGGVCFFGGYDDYKEVRWNVKPIDGGFRVMRLAVLGFWSSGVLGFWGSAFWRSVALSV